MSSFETKLQRASAGWVASRIISEEQREALLARHPAGAGGSRMAAVLGTIGGGLVLTGIFLVISANWERLPDWTKIGGLLVLLVSTQAAGWKLKFNPGLYPRIGDAFLMLGSGLFLAGVALVSQIFHLNARPATLVGIGWAGILVVPWITGSKGVQFMSLLAGLLWLGFEFSTSGSLLALADSMSGTDLFWVISALSIPIGLAVCLSGQWLRETRFSTFAGLHELLGLLIACGSLYLIGFLRHAWDWRPESAVAWMPLAAVVFLFFACLGLAWRARPKEVASFLPFVLLSVVPGAAVALGWSVGDGGWLWSALGWLGLFGLNLGMVRVGLVSGRAGWVNLGLLFIALNVLTRYFDLFASMLEGGVFFVLTGVLILVVGFSVERKRRELLRTMRTGGGNP